MRRLVVNALGLGMILVLAGACTGGSESAIETTTGQGGGVTGGEIIVSGDLTAGSSADSSTDAATATVDATVTTTAAATTIRPATTRPASTPPTTRPPRSDSGGSSTATTDAAVIGDGPVLNNPVGDDDFGESPGIGNGLVPVFFVLEATTKVGCGTANPGSVTLRWEVIGAESVDISIGFVGDIRHPDEMPAGTIDLPLDCATGSQYFVIAENPDGETIRSVTVSAR